MISDIGSMYTHTYIYIYTCIQKGPKVRDGCQPTSKWLEGSFVS